MERLPVRLAQESPDQPEIRALLAASDAYSAALYPAESNHLLSLAPLKEPNVRFIVARMGSVAAGCGAIVLSPEGYAEIKRMFVSPAARGLKIGKRLLEALERTARELSIPVLRLETGVRQPEALGLYRRAGFVEIAPFGSYRADPLSVFMEKRIVV